MPRLKFGQRVWRTLAAVAPDGMLSIQETAVMIRQIPPDLAPRIEALLTSGEFSTEEEVLREAVNTLERRQRAWQEMRQKVQEAEADIAAGRVGPFDAEQTKRAVRERLREKGITE